MLGAHSELMNFVSQLRSPEQTSICTPPYVTARLLLLRGRTPMAPPASRRAPLARLTFVTKSGSSEEGRRGVLMVNSVARTSGNRRRHFKVRLQECLRRQNPANYAETWNIRHFVGVWAPNRRLNEMLMRAAFPLYSGLKRQTIIVSSKSAF